MKLSKVTFTGIDEKTDLNRLVKLQKAYPYAEFGVLISYDWKSNGCRFPDPQFLKSLLPLGLNLSAHFCGQAALDIVYGKRFKTDALLDGCSKIFRRCQLNLKADGLFSELRKLKSLPFMDETIIQMHTPELCELFLHGQTPRFTSYLLDASGGAGIDTHIQVVTSPGVHIGYAGGIGPDNVEAKLRTLLEYDSQERFWIDMETRVRTVTDDGEWLDLDKVHEVLKICDHILKVNQ